MKICPEEGKHGWLGETLIIACGLCLMVLMGVLGIAAVTLFYRAFT